MFLLISSLLPRILVEKEGAIRMIVNYDVVFDGFKIECCFVEFEYVVSKHRKITRHSIAGTRVRGHFNSWKILTK